MRHRMCLAAAAVVQDDSEVSVRPISFRDGGCGAAAGGADAESKRGATQQGHERRQSVYQLTLSVYQLTLPVYRLTLPVYQLTLSVYQLTLSVYQLTLPAAGFHLVTILLFPSVL